LATKAIVPRDGPVGLPRRTQKQTTTHGRCVTGRLPLVKAGHPIGADVDTHRRLEDALTSGYTKASTTVHPVEGWELRILVLDRWRRPMIPSHGEPKKERSEPMDKLGSDDGLPLAHRTSEGAARILREAILAGRLKPGEPLRERLLAEEFGISRTPIREALFILQGEGLVELRPNRGAVVRTITSRDIEQIYALRAVLESHAARTAAENLCERHLDQLESAYARLRRLSSRSSASEQAEADLAFHSGISAATGSELLQTVVRQVFAVTVSYRSHYTYRVQEIRTANQQHRAILDALRDRDGELAEKLMREHVTWSSQLALEHFGLTP
jgi:DNA-binding GntR family transcriptional regulator